MTKPKIDRVNENDVARVTAYRLAGGWRVEMADSVAAVAPTLAVALRLAAARLDGDVAAASSTPAMPLLSSREIAEWLRISVRSAQILLATGAIKSISFGILRRCEVADVERYIAEQRAKGVTP